MILTEPLWTSYIDDAVYWRSQCDIDQRGNNIVRQDDLDKGRGHANRLPIGGELSGDRSYELKELRSAEDRIGYSCGLDQLLLSDFRTHLAAIRDAIGTDNGYCNVMTHTGDCLRGEQVPG